MWWTRSVAVLVILSLVSGCAAYKPVAIDRTSESGQLAAQPIVPGDKVRVTLNSGEVREFFVNTVEADRITGEGEAHDFSDIAQLEVRRADEGANTTIVAVVFIVGALILLAIEGLNDTVECLTGNCD